MQASSISIRKATLKDLDVLVDIALAAMPLDPQWDFRFPYRLEFPDETRLFTRMKYEEFLKNDDGHWLIIVAEWNEANSQTKPKAIAFALWEVKNLRQRRTCKSTPTLCSPPARVRLDGHAQRIQAWTRTMTEYKQLLFDDWYGRRHFHLQVLATHPNWHRRGAGTALVSWGVRKAKRTGMAVSLFASPMGQALYIQLGFRIIARVTVRADGEEESVTPAAMVFEPAVSQMPINYTMVVQARRQRSKFSRSGSVWMHRWHRVRGHRCNLNVLER